MIVRKIRRNELKRCQELSALCFEYSMGKSKLTPEEYARSVIENPRSLEDVHWDNRWAAFEDDGETMIATFVVIPWRAGFDGHETVMGGIGGVATLPHRRMSGAIRRCFEAALPDMHRSGMVLSYLYPFSNAFYRRFGYELACDAVNWRLRLEGMPMPKLQGTWHLCEPGNNRLADIRAVSRVRQQRYNCMVIAGETEYLWLEDNPCVTKEHTYVYYDRHGEPRSYLSVPALPGKDLACSRFVFNDREGFLGLLALLKRFAADHSHASMLLPSDVDLRGLLPEFSLGSVERTVVQYGMARVINVEAALGMAKARGSGTLRIAVSDDQIAENNGVFEVRYEPGAANVVRRVCTAPDVEANIRDFSRLLLGCCDPDPEWLPELKVNCPGEAVAALFYRKPVFITEKF